jgi:hypothetical protein
MTAAAPTINELNERLLETGKRFGNLYLDTCEKTAQGVADLTRDVAKTYVAAAREVIA